MRIVIGARKSPLAQVQARAVEASLRRTDPNLNTEMVFKSSLGDQNANDPLWQMPEKGVFTQDLSKDLIDGRVDLVVHSWKDLPIEERQHTIVAATLERSDPRDILFLKPGWQDAKKLHILTSSPRRVHHLEKNLAKWLCLANNTEIATEPVRGNVRTRCEKFLAHPKANGFVLAAAAFLRMIKSADHFPEEADFFANLRERLPYTYLPLEFFPTAAAQGALALEVRRNDTDLLNQISRINCQETWKNVIEEREILRGYGGGCHQKIGATVVSLKGKGRWRLASGESERGEPISEKEWLNPQGLALSDTHLISSRLFVRTERRWQEEYSAPLNPEGAKILSHPFVIEELARRQKLHSHNPWIVAGTKSFQLCRKYGVLPLMSLEGLGLNVWHRFDPLEFEKAQNLTQNLTSVHKHKNDEIVDVPVYQTQVTVDEAELRQLGSDTAIYWLSEEHARAALQLRPEIKHLAKHFCGPGKTSDRLASLFGDHIQVIRRG